MSWPTATPASSSCIWVMDNFTLPTNASVGFGIIGRQAIHRGTAGNVRELTTAIKKFVAGCNDRAPFVSTKTADDILKKANRQPAPNTDH